MTERESRMRPMVTRRGLLSGAAAGGALAVGALAGNVPAAAAPSAALRPRMLRQGDMVRLVSPAGPANATLVERGAQLLTEWGLRVEYGPHALDRNGFLAGADADRLADLNGALADPQVRGVICTRGGYGAQRIVDQIDAAAVLRDPKPVVGFSDITALQSALWRVARLATIHGPMAQWNDARTGPESAEGLRSALMTTAPVTVTRNPADVGGDVEVPGRATGVLLGGNLTLLDETLGTRDFPRLQGAILFFEEVGEAPYRIDRMLTHLRRAGVLTGLAGIALGQFVDCNGPAGTQTVSDVLRDRVATLGVPLLAGLPLGHGNGQLTVPLGVPATVDTAAGTLTVQAGVR